MVDPRMDLAESVAKRTAQCYRRQEDPCLSEEDLFAVAWVACWAACGTFVPGRSSLKSWLIGKARGAVLQEIRRRDHLSAWERRKLSGERAPVWKKRPVSIDSWDEKRRDYYEGRGIAAPWGEDPGERASPTLSVARESLDPREWEVVRLRSLGLSFDVIGERMGYTDRSYVNRIWHRSVKKLKAKLEAL